MNKKCINIFGIIRAKHLKIERNRKRNEGGREGRAQRNRKRNEG